MKKYYNEIYKNLQSSFNVINKQEFNGKQIGIIFPLSMISLEISDECRQQIPFQYINDHVKRWLPTFSIPATNSIFAPSHIILWNGNYLF